MFDMDDTDPNSFNNPVSISLSTNVNARRNNIPMKQINIQKLFLCFAALLSDVPSAPIFKCELVNGVSSLSEIFSYPSLLPNGTVQMILLLQLIIVCSKCPTKRYFIGLITQVGDL